jgi:uncharacterized membrane protein
MSTGPVGRVDVESQVAAWRAYLVREGVDGRDVEELETHLRDQMADLTRVGLTDDEAFLLAVRRLGAADVLSAQFMAENSGRAWKQLAVPTEPVNAPAGERATPGGVPRSLVEAIGFAVLAALAIQLPRLFDWPQDVLRNASVLTFPFLTWYYVRRRGLGRPARVAILGVFVAAALLVNLYPWDRQSDYLGEGQSATELLTVLHLPIATWFVVGFAFVAGQWRSTQRRMDFVRFTGEAVIYYALIALGGGVLLALTFSVLAPVSVDLADTVVGVVLPSGAAGAVLVAAWLVDAKQAVIENMAPVLTRVFTPLVTLMLIVCMVAYAAAGVSTTFDRDLLTVFDFLLVLVLGLVLYAMSARDETPRPELMDYLQLVAVVAALVLDAMVLASMLGRIGELGWTANRVAATGLNILLAVNLAGSAGLLVRFLRRRGGLLGLERWQMRYLPAFGLWAAAVVVVLPPVFGFA